MGARARGSREPELVDRALAAVDLIHQDLETPVHYSVDVLGVELVGHGRVVARTLPLFPSKLVFRMALTTRSRQQETFPEAPVRSPAAVGQVWLFGDSSCCCFCLMD